MLRNRLVVRKQARPARRFEAFRFLSTLTFERYGLLFTMASLNQEQPTAGDSGALAGKETLRLEKGGDPHKKHD